LVIALRALTVSVEFTKRLNQEILKQTKNSCNEATYSIMIGRAYRNFSTQEIKNRSVIFSKGGE
jgi:hypothetical protein